MHTDSQFLTITPIDPAEARQVMNGWSLLWHNAQFVLVQTAWLWGGAIGFWLCKPGFPFLMNLMGYISLWFAAGWLLTQFTIAFVYPEWPMNSRLCQNLRRCVIDRGDRSSINWHDRSKRVVEFVPRDRWNKMSMDTATDLMIFHIDQTGVLMEGDCNRYWLPCESIVDVQVESISPRGWFTDTHMIVITARSESGLVELPISLRDHGFGELRNSKRVRLADELANKIAGIASGVITEAPVVSDYSAPIPVSTNPYAAPAMLRD